MFGLEEVRIWEIMFQAILVEPVSIMNMQDRTRRDTAAGINHITTMMIAVVIGVKAVHIVLEVVVVF